MFLLDYKEHYVYLLIPMDLHVTGHTDAGDCQVLRNLAHEKQTV